MKNKMKKTKRFVNIYFPLSFLILIMSELSGCETMVIAMEPIPEEEVNTRGYPPPMLQEDSEFPSDETLSKNH